MVSRWLSSWSAFYSDRYTTALQALHGADLTGKTAIVTGGNSGIGVETVRALATAGAHVILTSRSVAAGEKVAQQLKKSGVKGDIVVMQLDLTDLASVKRFAKDFQAAERGPHLLILNAGVMACPQTYTPDGFEMQIGTNHFGHFVLTRELLPSMRSLGAPVRVIAVSSAAHTWGGLDLADLHYKHGRSYTPFGAYGQSKLANILFAKELARREASSNIKAYSVHPGPILTNLGRHLWLSTWTATLLASVLLCWYLKNAEQGASTTITAAVSPELEKHSGAYLANCHIVAPSTDGEDIALAGKLWEATEQQLAETEAGAAK